MSRRDFLKHLGFHQTKSPLAMSNEVTITQMNEAIARFMGGVKQIIPNGGLHGYKEGTVLWMYLFSGNADPVRSLEYHTSWDWLMSVWFKIQTLGADIGYSFKKFHEAFHAGIDVQSIGKCHATVYQFITWLNQQKQTNDNSVTKGKD